MRKDIHRIVDLDIHVIANGGEFAAVIGHEFSALGTNPIGRAPLPGELPSDDNAGTIFLRLVRFVSLVLDHHGDFSNAVKKMSVCVALMA